MIIDEVSSPAVPVIALIDAVAGTPEVHGVYEGVGGHFNRLKRLSELADAEVELLDVATGAMIPSEDGPVV